MPRLQPKRPRIATLVRKLVAPASFRTRKSRKLAGTSRLLRHGRVLASASRIAALVCLVHFQAAIAIAARKQVTARYNNASCQSIVFHVSHSVLWYKSCGSRCVASASGFPNLDLLRLPVCAFVPAHYYAARSYFFSTLPIASR